MPQSTSADLPNFSKLRVLVLGDLILDRYIRGTTDRTSPEAPVAVVEIRSEDNVPGGAANVARNAHAAGAKTFCAGVIGRDAAGNALLANLRKSGIDVSAVQRAARPTTVKTRILSHNQQMLRIDAEERSPIPAAVEQSLIRRLKKLLPTLDAIILSDYGKGVITSAIMHTAAELCSKSGVPLFVDPKGRDYPKYRGAYSLTPNAKEAAEATGEATGDENGLARAAAIIFKQTRARLLIITRGAAGIALFQPRKKPLLIPAAVREVFDVTGAGDTFIAFFALCTGARMQAAHAARVANAAAGIVVGKSGAATVSLSELNNALNPNPASRKIVAEADLAQLGARLRAESRKIVLTNGCFDFIHAGHVAFLQEARALGDVLILANNSDATIRKLKGHPRPIIPQQQRIKLLAAIEAVDHIVTFSDKTPHRLIRALKPDVLVKGDNYDMAEVEGANVVKSYGGRIDLIPVISQFSTAELISIRALAKRKRQRSTVSAKKALKSR